MRSLRRKIKFGTACTLVAAAVCGYLWFSAFLAGPEPPLGCGTVYYPAYMFSNEGGEALFKANCTSCHMVTKNLTGPALMGMAQRQPYKGFIVDLLLRPTQTRKKSAYAMSLSQTYNDKGHTSFAGILTKKDIEAIIDAFNFSAPIHGNVVK